MDTHKLSSDEKEPKAPYTITMEDADYQGLRHIIYSVTDEYAQATPLCIREVEICFVKDNRKYIPPRIQIRFRNVVFTYISQSSEDRVEEDGIFCLASVENTEIWLSYEFNQPKNSKPIDVVTAFGYAVPYEITPDLIIEMMNSDDELRYSLYSSTRGEN